MTERRSNFSEAVGMDADLANKALSLAVAAQSKHDRPYQSDKHSSYSIFAFRGSGTVEDWFSCTPFGDISIGLKKLFPKLKSIGNDEIAVVNGKFFEQFRDLLKQDALKEEFPLNNQAGLEHLFKDYRLGDEVSQALSNKRKIVFTGYSSGGPIAIFAALLFLHRNRIPPLCLTFGSPLVGNQIFGHALRREDWAQHFVHFVMRYDIIPRVLLAPLSSIKGELRSILPCFDPIKLESKTGSDEASSFFRAVMKNALSVASHTACSLMGCTNSLLQTVTSFTELSPYRPFGTYVFCTGEGKMFTLKNPDAILQVLFYSLQLDEGEKIKDVACRRFKDHIGYQNQFKDNLAKNVVDLEHLDLQLPLFSGGANCSETKSIEMAIKELGLSTKAMLCLIAARESEKQKQRNQKRIDNNREKIDNGLRKLQVYRDRSAILEIGYYDAFKRQEEEKDFDANVNRLELAGIWDEIIELLKRNELPDGFECRMEWVELGTKFRNLMEPLDIANFYRHSKDEDTGSYMKPDEGKQPRPKRYKYTQKWLEHALGMPAGHFSESCFWAEVEYLRIQTSNQKQNLDAAFEKVEDRVVKLEKNVFQWVQEEGELQWMYDKQLRREVLSKNSTFVKWWMELPEKHRMKSQIAIYMCGLETELTFLKLK